MKDNLFQSFLRPNISAKDRLAQGKSLRKKVPRASLAELRLKTKRQTPVDILLAQAKSRISHYVPIRHARMADNPFAFFRGGAAIFAHDIAKTPSPKISVQLCGDMHVSNFGFFSTTEHRLVFGINDFDETLPGNFDWDLKRLVASAMIASQQLGQDNVYGEAIVRNIATRYRQFLFEYADTPYINLAQSYIDESALTERSVNVSLLSQQLLQKLIGKARKNTNYGVIGKLTEQTPLGSRLIDAPPLTEHVQTSIRGELITDLLETALDSYAESLSSDRKNLFMRYRLIDWVRKVVGVGSVGTSCWVLYLEGQDETDPLFLQIKEAQQSVLAPYFPDSKFTSDGERVIHGQRLIQGAPDLFLGYGRAGRGGFYMRQLRDMKGGISVGQGGIDVKEFPDFAKLFGWALANAHARSGDPAILAGYCGKGEALDDALVKFSIAYSEQNSADYDSFLRAIKSGKMSCATENF